MGTRILVALIYLYVYGRFLFTVATTVEFVSFTTDASLSAFFYAIRWSILLSGVLTTCFVLLISISFFKKNWFRPSIVVVDILSIPIALGMEFVGLQNANALSFIPLSLWDVLFEHPMLLVVNWPFHGAEILRPVLVWLYLYKLKPVDAYFAKFSESRVLPNEIHP